MTMTVAVTRNVPGRFRGFLSSCMLELAPSVYIAPRMRKAVRERVWTVMEEWAELLPADGGVCLFWRQKSAPGGLAFRTIGFPKKELIEHDGLWLTRSALRAEHDIEELEACVTRAETASD